MWNSLLDLMLEQHGRKKSTTRECFGVTAGCPRSGGARWCSAAWGRRSGRSCWPGCSCSLPQRRGSCKPGAKAAGRTAGGVKLLAALGRRRRETEGLPAQGVDGFRSWKGGTKNNRHVRVWVKQVVFTLFSDANLAFPSSQTDHSKQVLEHKERHHSHWWGSSLPWHYWDLPFERAPMDWGLSSLSVLHGLFDTKWLSQGQVSFSKHAGGIKGGFKTKMFSIWHKKNLCKPGLYITAEILEQEC